jgi:D-serine deaminase-like pyridoxal phosphate-dependent protein
MIAIAGHPDRLRPHVKTHKTKELIRMQLDLGITRFKCATLAEVEMVAAAGGSDILLAYPLLGPSVQRFLDIMDRHPEIRLAVTADSKEGVQELGRTCRDTGKQADLFVDLDVGMHRTGILPGDAMDLINLILSEKGLSFKGLHLYDGHIHETDPEERRLHSEKEFRDVQLLIDALMNRGIDIEELACGGTPTFPIHARHSERTLCPGTPVLWDAGYGQAFPDLYFLPAAVLAGRVISRPAGHLCIDLGYKAVASEMPHPRVQFLNLEHNEFLNHSEEHLVVASPTEDQIPIGQVIYALPMHICPTMALQDRVWVVKEGQISGNWEVVARNRNFTN